MVDVSAMEPTQPEASTSSAEKPARPMCCVCDHRYSIYTCPRCSARTCSLPCSTGHKDLSGCTGERNKVAYVPMNQYGWGTMMNDYTFLEEVGRRVGDWGKEIVKGGFEIQGLGAGSGAPGRGRGGVLGRGRGRGRTAGNTKRDLLKMQLEARDIDMDFLPAGMERRKLNQSYWEPKTHTAFLTLEFKIHPPRDPLAPSSRLPDPPYVLLTHRNSTNTPLLTLTRQIAHRALSKKDSPAPEWIRRLLECDPDDPDSFSPPHFVMTAQRDPRALALAKSRHRSAYYRLDPSKTLAILLKNTHFVEFPTIEVLEEFNGTVVDAQGMVTEFAANEEPKAKRRKLSAKAGKQAINGLVGGYGSEDSDDEETPQSGLALLGGYTGSDGEDAAADELKMDFLEDEALIDSEEELEVQIDPAVLLELMRQTQGNEQWAEKFEGDDEVDWGASGDDDEPE